MRKILAILLTVMGVGVTTAAAEVVEIPLPGVLGIYSFGPSNCCRTVSFQLPKVPLAIHGASFRVSGTTEVGSYECYWDGLHPWSTLLWASMIDKPGIDGWIANGPMPQQPGVFSWTATFHSNPSTATWGFLMDGQAQITVVGVPSEYSEICYPVSASPTLTVTEAVLTIDAEFPVPVEPTSWGRIKALYESP